MAKIRFELLGTDKSPLTIIPGVHSQFNDLMVTDNGKRRELRYCETEKSIWKDEQNKDSETTLIKFHNGILEVDEDENSTLIDFLRAAPKNGSVFIEVDLSKKAKEAVDKEELMYKAKGFIFTSSEEVLSNVAKILIPSIENESIEVIKKGLIELAGSEPELVISKFDKKDANQDIELEAQIKEAFDKRVLIVNDEMTEIQWGFNQEKIVAKQKTKDALPIALNFFNNEKNAEHKATLIQRLTEGND